MSVSPITSHILDTARGCPAEGVKIKLEINNAGQWNLLGQGSSNKDGRVSNLLPAEHKLESGIYRVRFETGDYFSKHKIEGFYPYIEVVFQLKEPAEHYHIPLLLSPFGYSTYRGS